MSRTTMAMFLALFTSGCATGFSHSLHEYDRLDLPEDHAGEPQQLVEGNTHQDVTLLTGNTDFVDVAYRRLLAECPHGRIVNVSARSTTQLGFLAYRNTMKFEGI